MRRGASGRAWFVRADSRGGCNWSANSVGLGLTILCCRHASALISVRLQCRHRANTIGEESYLHTDLVSHHGPDQPTNRPPPPMHDISAYGIWGTRSPGTLHGGNSCLGTYRTREQRRVRDQ